MYREFDVAMRRRRDEAERDITLAWYVAALSRQKELPQLKTLLVSRKGKQSSGDMLASMYAISEQYGLRIRRIPKES